MSVEATVTALQALHSTVTGVKRAPSLADYPDAINTTDLPLVLTWPGKGQWLALNQGYRRQDRVYLVEVYLRPAGQGNGLGGAAQLGAQLLQRLGELYLAAESVQLVNTPPYQATLKPDGAHIEDSGIGETMLVYGKQTFYGFVVQVGVYEKW